jgi:hypothetical protein
MLKAPSASTYVCFAFWLTILGILMVGLIGQVRPGKYYVSAEVSASEQKVGLSFALQPDPTLVNAPVNDIIFNQVCLILQ